MRRLSEEEMELRLRQIHTLAEVRSLAEEVERLALPLDGRAGLYRQLLRKAPALDLPLLEWIGRLAPYVCESVLENARLGPMGQRRLASACARRLVAYAYGEHNGAPDGVIQTLEAAYANGLLGRHSRPTLRLWQTLRHLQENLPEEARARTWSHRAQAGLGRVLVCCPTLTERDLLRLIQRASPLYDSPYQERLALHPQAGLRIWRALRDLVQGTLEEEDLREILVRIPPARTDPALRPFLERSPHAEVQSYLCLDAGPETGERFRLLAARSSADAAWVLAHPEFQGLHHLSREDLLPLLSSSRPEVRLEAIQALGRLEEALLRPRSLGAEYRALWRERYQSPLFPL